VPCYANIYLLSVVGEDSRNDVLRIITSISGLELVENVQSRVVPNMFFLRVKCDEREKCFELKQLLERELHSLPWVKIEVVCP